MNHYTRRAILMMDRARPPSGYRPETPEECARLLAALEELGYAMYRNSGMSSKQARKLAQQTHSGKAGLLLLQVGFMEGPHD